MAEDKNIHQICAGLSRYFAKHDSAYEGNFTEYCDENGLDWETIVDELKATPEESLLTDFDAFGDLDAFPGTKGMDEDAVKALIHAVITRCSEHPNAYSKVDLKVTKDQLMVSNAEITAVIALYEAQLQTLFDAGMKKDGSILGLLAIGRKLKVPYLMWLADAVTRERIRLNDQSMDVVRFIPKHCKMIKNLGVDGFADKIHAAITSFFSRISPAIMLKPARRIVADVASTCELFASAIELVHNKAVSGGALTCPFQFDATFAFAKSKTTGDLDFASGSDDDDDDDDDDEVKEEEKEQKDPVGDIAQRIEAEGLMSCTSPVAADSRAFIDPFKEFVKKNGMNKEKKNKDYPHKRRFCAIVDRREGGAKDQLTFFEPPANCNSFPEGGYVQLWYFDSARTCILPNEGYDAGKDGLTKKSLTLNSATPGPVITLSFHVESQDEIRCYLCVNGGSMRMMPEDLKNVVPKFFDDKFGDNANWAKSKVAADLVERIKPMLVDAKFASFYESCKMVV